MSLRSAYQSLITNHAAFGLSPIRRAFACSGQAFHFSPLTNPLPPLTSHISRLTSHISHLTAASAAQRVSQCEIQVFFRL
jgi:hypothetical protein